MAVIYGLKNCDTCRNAVRAFGEAGENVGLRDVRAEPLLADDLNRFLAAFGDQLVNLRSTTWRGLDEAARERPAVDLLQEYPALMKRPVIESGDQLTLGWDAAVKEAHLG